MPLKSKKQASYLKRNKPSVYKKLADPKYKKKKSFTPHKMYKGTMVKTAKTNAEHLRLGKLGWKHTKPKSKKMKSY
jgi:Tfp pilus assembly protein PilF